MAGINPTRKKPANAKNPDSAMAIFKLSSGRLVSGSTKWWFENAPKGYRYYCIHSILLTGECDKCKRGVMRFDRSGS